MKVLRFIAILFIILLHGEAKAQQNDLNDFLKRFKIFTETNYPKVKWSMPIINPESNTTPMPNAINPRESYMTDPTTGLRILPEQGKVFDPKTGYIVSYNPEVEYYVDLEKGKIYKGKSEVKIEKQKK